MSFEQDMTQIRLHEKWKKNPASYIKPPAPDPLERHDACIINVPRCREEVSYILYVDGQRVATRGLAASEFLNQDPDTLRSATLHAKSKPGFHVYYKHGAFWYGVAKHFDNLAEAIPFIHSGLRVLIEYRFTNIRVKYLVIGGYETDDGINRQNIWRTPEELCELYGVSPDECLFEEYGGCLPPNGPLIVLRPRYSAEGKTESPRKDYEAARLSLKHFGRLASTK